LIADLPVKLRGSALAALLLRLGGWRVRCEGLPTEQGVAIVYPHTSNWDFVVGILAKWAIGIPVTFWGKDTLFKLPLLGIWLRWVGGVPVDRHGASGAVAQMSAALIAAREQGRFMWLALSPEGTRRLTPAWRSGFYHVALQARVPLALVYFDYRERTVGIERFLQLSGDATADFAEIEAGMVRGVGRRPAHAAPIRLAD
jgi:1-acyl-sn-glycerol-3-phosphate acyltransferase